MNRLIKRLIIFLVRKRLKLKKYEIFKFKNQKTDNVYYFAATKVLKIENGVTMRSGVSLNWLLNDQCEIERVDK
jgi:hypothetical protein